MNEDFETGEQARARIEARDGRMKDDLQQNFSGRTWFSSGVNQND